MDKKFLQKTILLVTLVIGSTTVNAQTKAPVTKADTAKKIAALGNKTQSPAGTPSLTQSTKPQTATGSTPAAKTTPSSTANGAKPSTVIKPDTGKNKKTAPANTVLKATKKADDNSNDGGRGKTIFAELGGPGLALSLNYDFRFADQQDGWGMRFGAGYFGADGNIMISAPVQINYLLGHDSKFLELGAGGTFLKTKGNPEDSFFIFDKVTGVVGTITIGYRYQPSQPGFSFRAALNPIIYNQGLIPAAGVSLGYSF